MPDVITVARKASIISRLVREQIENPSDELLLEIIELADDFRDQAGEISES